YNISRSYGSQFPVSFVNPRLKPGATIPGRASGSLSCLYLASQTKYIILPFSIWSNFISSMLNILSPTFRGVHSLLLRYCCPIQFREPEIHALFIALIWAYIPISCTNRFSIHMREPEARTHFVAPGFNPVLVEYKTLRSVGSTDNFPAQASRFCSLSIVHYPLSIVHYPLSTIHCPLSIVHYPLSTIHCPLSILHYPLSTIHSPLSILHYPLSTIHCPLSILHYPFSTILYPLPIHH